VDLDIVATLADGRVLAGEVKWSSTPASPEVHFRLRAKLEALAGSGVKWDHAAAGGPDARHYLYVSAAGFTADFRALAARDGAVQLVALNEMYA
jgi:hypothetical protein